MNSPEMTDARDARETTRELDDARAKYRGKIIPKPALRMMDVDYTRRLDPDDVIAALKKLSGVETGRTNDETGK